jgi:hypothetical protein
MRLQSPGHRQRTRCHSPQESSHSTRRGALRSAPQLRSLRASNREWRLRPLPCRMTPPDTASLNCPHKSTLVQQRRGSRRGRHPEAGRERRGGEEGVVRRGAARHERPGTPPPPHRCHPCTQNGAQQAGSMLPLQGARGTQGGCRSSTRRNPPLLQHAPLGGEVVEATPRGGLLGAWENHSFQRNSPQQAGVGLRQGR